MTDAFDDERVQFFLRHRTEIREWARIEHEVIAATRQLLASTQADIEARIASLDPSVTSERHDGGKYERFLVRRPVWLSGVGVMLEWESSVDPFGSSLPKYGIAFFNWDAGMEPVCARMVDIAKATPVLTGGGFKVPGGRPWPAVRWVSKSKDWWQDPEAWAGAVVDAVAGVWDVAAAVIDRTLDVAPADGLAVVPAPEREGIR